MINLLETGRIKDALNELPEAAEQIISLTPLGVCITNQEGRFVAANDAYWRIYGYSRQQLIGTPFTIVAKEKDHVHMAALHTNVSAR